MPQSIPCAPEGRVGGACRHVAGLTSEAVVSLTVLSGLLLDTARWNAPGSQQQVSSDAAGLVGPEAAGRGPPRRLDTASRGLSLHLAASETGPR